MPGEDALRDLHRAVVKGDIDAVRGFLRRDAPLVNRRDAHGDTALIKCSRRGHLNVARLLADSTSTRRTTTATRR